MESTVFEDLEIPIDRITEASYVEVFTKDVFEAAKKLEDIMDDSSTVTKLEREVKEEWKNDKNARKELNAYFKEISDKIYEDADDSLPLHIVVGLIQDLRTLAHDLEILIHANLRTQLSQEVSPLQDKKLAQIRHKKLRDAWKVYATFAKGFWNIEVPTIKSKPGNYAPTIVDTLVFRWQGGEYYNPRVVASKLGLDTEDRTYMDFVEIFDAQPELKVEMIRIPL